MLINIVAKIKFYQQNEGTFDGVKNFMVMIFGMFAFSFQWSIENIEK